MSLQGTGVWSPGVWASTVWADCVWYETTCVVAPSAVVAAGGWFDFPDRPPRRQEKKKKKVEKIVQRIVQRVIDKPKEDQELALRLALVTEEIRYNKLYLEILIKEVQKRKKRRRKAAILLLT